jgi:CAAX protease family protein
LVRAVLYLVFYVLIQLAVAFALSLSALLLGDRWFQPAGFVSSNEILLLAIALSAPPTVGMTLLFVRFLDRRKLASLGVRWPEGGRQAALRQLVTISFGTLALLGGWLALVLALPPSLAVVRLAGVSPAFTAGPAWWPFPPGLLLILLLPGFLLQGGLEEWVVRGYIYRALKDRWRPWTAALASALLFALLHAANPQVSAVALLNIVLAGLILAALVERSGSLWSATLAHGVWNFAVACLLSLPISGVRMFHLLDVSVTGDERLTGGAFGPEGSLLLTLVGLPLAAALWWRARQDRRRREIAPSAQEDAPGVAAL